MKKTIAILVLSLLLTTAAQAQIFLTESDEGPRQTADPSGFIPLPGEYGSGADWYVPVGDGVLLLAALGGAYLLKRKRNIGNK
jgi:hypothetical protein